MGRDDKSSKLYLADIFESINIIQEYINGKTAEDFIKDIGLQDKVIRRIEIIGEAAKYVSKELRDKTLEIPWALITDMRNVMIHEYFGIDMRRVWSVVNGVKLKELKSGVERLLKDYI